MLEVRRRFVVGSGRPSTLMLVRSAAALATMRPETRRRDPITRDNSRRVRPFCLKVTPRACMAHPGGYGAIQAVPRCRGGASPRAARTQAGAARALAASALALCLAALLFADRKPSALLSRLHTAQLSWAGAGAGGDTGARYHWTAHSFSPVRGHEVQVDLTHDHSSVANWWDRAAYARSAYKSCISCVRTQRVRAATHTNTPAR